MSNIYFAVVIACFALHIHFSFRQICSIAEAIWKYTIKERASTMVVIKGLAITAGSKPIRFARIGRVQPIIFARNTATSQGQAHNKGHRYAYSVKQKQFDEIGKGRVMPQSIATRISFQITANVSL